MVRAPLHFHGRIPVPEVAPLTYRDGVTHLELVYELSQYLKHILHPSLQSTVDQVVADAERLLSEANAQYVDGVQEFQRIHDAFMSDVNASLMALNDGAVSDLVKDETSRLGKVLRELFTSLAEDPRSDFTDSLRELYQRRSAISVSNFDGDTDNGKLRNAIQEALRLGLGVQIDQDLQLTQNIPDFWEIVLTGTGKITREGRTFTPTPHTTDDGIITNTIYVDAQNGYDNNDGLSPGHALKTMQAAYSKVLRRLSAQQASNAKWVVNLKGTFPERVSLGQLPEFPYGLVITGEETSGRPVTRFQGTHRNSGANIGLWFEPGTPGVEVRHIHFDGYTSGSANGYGVLMKFNGKIRVQHCEFTNCNFGASAIQNVVFEIWDNWVADCRNGVSAQYNSTGNFNRNEITRCEHYGVSVTRNVICHVDYNDISYCDAAGVRIEHASRASVVGSEFYANKVGVLIQHNGLWGNTNNIFRDVPGHTQNHFSHQGNGSYQRWEQGVATSDEQHVGASLALPNYREPHTITNVDERTLLMFGGFLGNIEPQWFTHPGKKIRFEISGRTPELLYSNELFLMLVPNSGPHHIIGSITLPPGHEGDFFAELLIHAIEPEKQRTFTKFIGENGETQFTQRERVVPAYGEGGAFRLEVNPSRHNVDPLDFVTIYHMDTYFTG